jgi:hypothetical protein
MTLRRGSARRVPLLRHESTPLRVFYARMRPSKAPSHPPGSPIRPRGDPRGGKRGPRGLEEYPSPTLSLPQSPLNDRGGGPDARMRSRIHPLDDLLRQCDHQLVVKNRDLMNVRRGSGAPRRARPYGGRKWCFRCQRRGLGDLNLPSKRTSSPSSRIRRPRRGCCRAFRGPEEGARPALRGEKRNKSASSRPVSPE